MLSSVEADQPKAYVHSGAGTGVVDTAPLFPTTLTVPSTWSRSRDQTIEFWFKKEPTSTGTYCVLSVGLNSSNRMIVAVVRSNHTVNAGRVTISFAGAVSGTWATANRYDDGQWHHCVIELINYADVLNQYFYIDGQLESQNYADTDYTFGSWGNTYIGDCSKFVSGYVISGSPIDEIALYDKILADERIAAHYNEVMFGPPALPGPSVAIAGQVNVSGSLKTNKRLRLSTAQFDIDGLIRARILKDPLPFFIASQVDIFGSLAVAKAGKPVATSARMQSSDIDIIVQKGIGIRI